MKITLLTPGTGHFYCGSCIRDVELATALRKLGHDVFIVPLYLPFMVEENAAEADAEIFLGGANMYLQQKLPVLGKLPRFLTSWLDSPRLLRWLARKGDMTRTESLAAMTLSTIRGEEGRQRAEVERLAGWLASEEKPDVVLLSNAMLLGLAKRLHERTGVRIFCTLQGEAPFIDSLPEPYRSQCWQAMSERAGLVEAFIPVSQYYGDLMAERLALDPDRLRVVLNGIDLSDFELNPASDGPPTVGYLARLCEDKGFDTLVDAFCLLKERRPDARLCAVGVALREDEPLIAKCQERLRTLGIDGDVEIHRDVSRVDKLRFLRQFTVFSVPATYGESFGLYLLEAFACGIPAVQPRHGAFPELIERTGGGVLCEPNDPRSLADGLAELLEDAERRRTIGERARRSALEDFSVARMAEDVARVFAGTPERV